MIRWYHDEGSIWAGYTDNRRIIKQHGSIEPYDLYLSSFINGDAPDIEAASAYLDRQHTRNNINKRKRYRKHHPNAKVWRP